MVAYLIYKISRIPLNWVKLRLKFDWLESHPVMHLLEFIFSKFKHQLLQWWRIASDCADLSPHAITTWPIFFYEGWSSHLQHGTSECRRSTTLAEKLGITHLHQLWNWFERIRFMMHNPLRFFLLCGVSWVTLEAISVAGYPGLGRTIERFISATAIEINYSFSKGKVFGPSGGHSL